jgi:CPA2 family monovalent cation:H+ antiporter-2
MHLLPLIQDLAVILGIASLVSFISQRIKQPVVLGYLIAGIIVGPYTPPFSFVLDLPGIHTWAELGVILLMFSLGIEFSLKKLACNGKTAVFTGLFEAIFMLGLGFAAGRIVGWSIIDSIFLGAILSISSTAIIIKAIEELNLKAKPSSKLIFGILIVEDLVGILILAALPLFSVHERFEGFALAWAGGKLIFIVSCWLSVGYLVIPKLTNYVGKRMNDEMLTIFSLALCLGLVVFSAQLSYPVALGAFIMGSILAESKESIRIENLIKPLHDLFGAVFFVSIGMLLNPADILDNWRMILALSILTIIGKIVSTVIGTKVTGQDLRTSIQVGFSLAQIGEFSFIIAGLGLELGVMRPSLYPIAVSISVITTFTTPYLIRLSEKITIAKTV